MVVDKGRCFICDVKLGSVDKMQYLKNVPLKNVPLSDRGLPLTIQDSKDLMRSYDDLRVCIGCFNTINIIHQLSEKQLKEVLARCF